MSRYRYRVHASTIPACLKPTGCAGSAACSVTLESAGPAGRSSGTALRTIQNPHEWNLTGSASPGTRLRFRTLDYGSIPCNLHGPDCRPSARCVKSCSRCTLIQRTLSRTSTAPEILSTDCVKSYCVLHSSQINTARRRSGNPVSRGDSEIFHCPDCPAFSVLYGQILQTCFFLFFSVKDPDSSRVVPCITRRAIADWQVTVWHFCNCFRETSR